MGENCIHSSYLLSFITKFFVMAWRFFCINYLFYFLLPFFSALLGLFLSTIFYIASFFGIILMYYLYALESTCVINIFFITWTAILVKVMMIVSLHSKVCSTNIYILWIFSQIRSFISQPTLRHITILICSREFLCDHWKCYLCSMYKFLLSITQMCICKLKIRGLLRLSWRCYAHSDKTSVLFFLRFTRVGNASTVKIMKNKNA